MIDLIYNKDAFYSFLLENRSVMLLLSRNKRENFDYF